MGYQLDAVGLFFFFSVAVWQCETTMLIMVHTRDGHVLIGLVQGGAPQTL